MSVNESNTVVSNIYCFGSLAHIILTKKPAAKFRTLLRQSIWLSGFSFPLLDAIKNNHWDLPQLLQIFLAKFLSFPHNVIDFLLSASSSSDQNNNARNVPDPL